VGDFITSWRRISIHHYRVVAETNTGALETFDVTNSINKPNTGPIINAPPTTYHLNMWQLLVKKCFRV
jgi:hypothetical protein